MNDASTPPTSPTSAERDPTRAPRARDERTAVDKAISVMLAFDGDAHVGVGVSELARRTGLSKSTTFRLLGALERNGVVERAGTAYRLGEFLHDLGARAGTPGQDAVCDLLTPFLADLYEATHLTVQIAMLQGSRVTYLSKLEGHQRLRSPSRIGGRMPAYSTGVGKALLAHDVDALEETLDAPRHAWTPHTIVDRDELLAELDRVRETGVAYDWGESLETLACVAAPVMAAPGVAIAALSVSGPAGRFDPTGVEATLRRIAFAASRAAARSGAFARAAA